MMDLSLLNLLETERKALWEKSFDEKEISRRKTYMEDTTLTEGEILYHTRILAEDEADLVKVTQLLDETRSSIARYIKEILAEYA